MMKKLVLFGLLAAVLVAPSAAHAKRQNLILSFGQDVLLVGKDDLSIRAQCVQNEGGMGSDVVRVYAVTANDAVTRGWGPSYYGNGNYLTSMTPTVDSMLTHLVRPTGQESVYSQADAGTVLNLTTMHGYAINLESAMMGLNVDGNDCLLSIDIGEVKKFKETF